MPRRERTLEEVAEDLEQLTAQVQRLADQIHNAPYVRIDLHNEQIANIRNDIGGVKTMLMWILGLLGSILVAAVVVVITAIAQGRVG